MIKNIILGLVITLSIVGFAAPAFAAEKNHPPLLLKKVELIYPEDALKEGVEGTAVLKIFVSDKGTVEQVDVIQSTGNTSLDQASINTVKQWEFVPAYKEGKKCSAEIKLTVAFYISNQQGVSSGMTFFAL